jgi:hypothetical protein
MAEMNLAEELRSILRQVEDLPDHDVESISVLINAGEWKVALETLCTQIHEYDCELNRETRGRLLRVGRHVGVPAGHLLGDPWEEPG